MNLADRLATLNAPKPRMRLALLSPVASGELDRHSAEMVSRAAAFLILSAQLALQTPNLKNEFFTSGKMVSASMTVTFADLTIPQTKPTSP